MRASLSVVACALVACSSEPQVTGRPLAAMSLIAAPGDCIDPRTLGAVADDGVDDREALQTAIDKGVATRRPVCIGPGRYDVTRPANRIASLLVAGDGAVIEGAGPGLTTLSMMGGWPGDWRLLEITGTRHRVAGIGIDASARGLTTKDQVHLIQVTGPAQSIVLSDLRLNIPELPGMEAGDCIRLLGEQSAVVDGVLIERVTMPACDRSAVAFQRGVRNVWIEHIETEIVGGQAIDFEPSGLGVVEMITIRDSVLRTGHAGVNTAIAGGSSAASRVTLERVEMDGQLFLVGVAHSTFRDLSISVADDPPIMAQKAGAGIRIDGGRFERLPGLEGPVINIVAHNGGYPSDVWIGGGVAVVQRANGPAIRTRPTTGLVVDGASIECASPTANEHPAIILGNTPESPGDPAAFPTRTRVANSSVIGNCRYALVSGPGGSVVFSGNVVETMTGAVQFSAPPTIMPVVTGNVVSAPPGAATIVVSPVQTPFAGSNGT